MERLEGGIHRCACVRPCSSRQPAIGVRSVIQGGLERSCGCVALLHGVQERDRGEQTTFSRRHHPHLLFKRFACGAASLRIHAHACRAWKRALESLRNPKEGGVARESSHLSESRVRPLGHRLSPLVSLYCQPRLPELRKRSRLHLPPLADLRGRCGERLPNGATPRKDGERREKREKKILEALCNQDSRRMGNRIRHTVRRGRGARCWVRLGGKGAGAHLRLSQRLLRPTLKENAFDLRYFDGVIAGAILRQAGRGERG